LLNRPGRPTAIAAGNNIALIGAMHALREKAFRVPEDVALVGFDDFEWADYFEPRLIVIAQPCQAIGKEAALLLFERIGSMDGKRRSAEDGACSSNVVWVARSPRALWT
jgi:LacI family transcriptional regulator